MEMDEVICQIQQWRNRMTNITNPDENEPDSNYPLAEYHSEAYDRIFKKGSGPESDGGETEYTSRATRERKYTPDEEMVAKVIIVHLICTTR